MAHMMMKSRKEQSKTENKQNKREEEEVAKMDEAARIETCALFRLVPVPPRVLIADSAGFVPIVPESYDIWTVWVAGSGGSGVV